MARATSTCLAAFAIFLCGCGPSTPASGRDQVLRIGVRDFAIHAPRVIRAGAVTLDVHNAGPDQHELILVRSGRPLPLRSDAMTVDEDAIEKATVGEVAGLPPGQGASARFDLRPGRYVLLCNMFGHYRGGMHTELVVR